jgi:hypothetical protein
MVEIRSADVANRYFLSAFHPLLHCLHALSHGSRKFPLVESDPFRPHHGGELFRVYCPEDFSPEFDVFFHSGGKPSRICQ